MNSHHRISMITTVIVPMDRMSHARQHALECRKPLSSFVGAVDF